MPTTPPTKAWNKGEYFRPVLLQGHYPKDLWMKMEQHTGSKGHLGTVHLGQRASVGTALSPGQLAEGTWKTRAKLLSPTSQANRSWLSRNFTGAQSPPPPHEDLNDLHLAKRKSQPGPNSSTPSMIFLRRILSVPCEPCPQPGPQKAVL